MVLKESHADPTDGSAAIVGRSACLASAWSATKNRISNQPLIQIWHLSQETAHSTIFVGTKNYQISFQPSFVRIIDEIVLY